MNPVVGNYRSERPYGQKSERKCVIVKTSLLLAMAASITFGCSVYGEGITNIIQCMNIALTSDVFKRFPTNATATAQDCVLSFVKGSVHGDLRTFALPFSEQIRSSEFGFTNIDYIPAFLSNEFSELMSSISNCTTKVVAYNETTNEGLTKASITMHRIGMNHNLVEVSHLDIAKTNNVWNIVNS